MPGLFAIPTAKDKLHLLPFYFQWLRLKELNYVSSPPVETWWTSVNLHLRTPGNAEDLATQIGQLDA